MGYTEVSIHFPEKIAGKAETVSTLALVISDYKFNAVVPVLVGTNTLDTLFKSCVANDNSYAAPKDKFQHVPLLKILLRRYILGQSNGKVGQVKLQGQKCVTIPAGQKMVLDGYARNVATVADAPLVVEPSTHSSLPGGLLLCSYVLTSPRRTSFKVPIILQNETTHEITLPANCCLAELYAPSALSSLRNTSAK